jgi:hypothetical protein
MGDIEAALGQLLFVFSGKTPDHKVRIYKEYHSVRPRTLPTPLSLASVPLPPDPGVGGTLACG